MRTMTCIILILAGTIIIGCANRPTISIDVNRTGVNADRVVVEFDKSGLSPKDTVYVSHENIDPGHDKLTIVPEADAMARGDIRIRVIVESRSTPSTRPALP